MPNMPQHLLHLNTARVLAKLMDEQFSLFGIKFGLDAIFGLVPGLGDMLSMLFSFYLIWIGTEMKLPQQKIWLMVKNMLLDVLVSTLPVIGDIGDVFLRVNIKNLAILETHIAQTNKTDDVLEGEVI